MTYLAIAFIVLWAIIAIYVTVLMKRVGRLEKKLRNVNNQHVAEQNHKS